MIRKSIHIALAFDEHFINQFYALATSVFKHNMHVSITIHAIISGVTEDEKKQIEQYAASQNATVLFYSVPTGFGEDFVLNGNWTAATYYRLLLPQLLPVYIEKYLYIDTDTLVVGDLLPMFDTDISNYYVAAVCDRLVPTRPDLEIIQPYTYFNAGVLLVNRKMWEANGITEKAIAFLTAFPEKIHYADQDALNYLFRDKWKQMPVKYNLMYANIPEGLSRKEYSQFIKDKVIIHFTQHRPWKMLCRNPYRSLYSFYLKRSPLKVKNKYTDFSVSQLPNWIKIRLLELYLEMSLIKKAWRFVKRTS